MDPKTKRLSDIGEALHGKTWQSRLAADLGLSAGYMSQLVSGARRVTPEVEELVARRLVDVIIPELEATTAELRTHANAMAAELGLEIEPPAERRYVKEASR